MMSPSALKGRKAIITGRIPLSTSIATAHKGHREQQAEQGKGGLAGSRGVFKVMLIAMELQHAFL